MNHNKLIKYLNWLIEESDFNAKERERFLGKDNAGAIANRECSRVAKMIKEKIINRDFE